MFTNKEELKNKIIYRASYRGTKEMDILLKSFVNKNIKTLEKDDLIELEKFLSYEDEIIYNYYHYNICKNNIENNKFSKIFRNFRI